MNGAKYYMNDRHGTPVFYAVLGTKGGRGHTYIRVINSDQPEISVETAWLYPEALKKVDKERFVAELQVASAKVLSLV